MHWSVPSTSIRWHFLIFYCVKSKLWVRRTQKLFCQKQRADEWKNQFPVTHIFLRLFIAGYPRYCTVTTLPDGTTVLNGGRSRRGKPRGPPGSRELQTALKGCDDPMFLDFIRRCLEWDPVTRMTPNAALRHGWLRRRLPRPPPTGDKSSVTDSPSGTLTSMRSTTNSGTSRTNSNNAKMNTIGSMHSASNSGGGSSASAAVTAAAVAAKLDANLHSRHNSTTASSVTVASTKLPQIPNTIS